MKNFKIRQLSNGFMIMEVAIAVAIMGILLTPILILQNNIFKRIIRNKQKIEYLLPVKKMFYQVHIDDDKNQQSVTSIISEPDMELTYETVPVRNSQLVRFKNLCTKTVTGRWDDWGGTRQEKMQDLVFKVPQSSEKKE